MAVSTDAFASDVDFRPFWGTAAQAGGRAIKQNLSDLAAMGAQPLGFTWSLSISHDWLNNSEGFQSFVHGAAQVCREHQLLLLGGDLGWQKEGFSCHITIIGETHGAGLGHQSAQPEESLWLSGPLGESHLGLSLIQQAHHAQPFLSDPQFQTWVQNRSKQERKWVERHLNGHHELGLGHHLNGLASACIDISDGLSSDLHKICRASGVGASLELAPLVQHLPQTTPKQSQQVEHAVLHGGEDFVLLFSVPKAKENELNSLIEAGFCLQKIGQTNTEKSQITLHSAGCTKMLHPLGWDAINLY